MKWPLFISFLILTNGLAWSEVMVAKHEQLTLWFFDVGQGDSELIDFGRAQILVDGGPTNGKVLNGLAKALKTGDQTIDLAILTHAHLDHFGGLVEAAKRYHVKLFATPGTIGTAPAYQSLEKPDITLGEGDTIRYKNYRLRFLSPSAAEKRNDDPNKTSLVFLLEAPDLTALYMGDAHGDNEERLRKKYNLKTDILKVGHHGSRFSSTAAFINETKPKVAIFEVGKNSYGHPHPSVATKLSAIGTKTYATLNHGTIKMTVVNGKLKIFTER